LTRQAQGWLQPAGTGGQPQTITVSWQQRLPAKKRTRIQEKIRETTYPRYGAHPRYRWNRIGGRSSQERNRHDETQRRAYPTLRPVGVPGLPLNFAVFGWGELRPLLH
jgi:hypothetical protein